MPSLLRYSAVAALVASVVSAGRWRGGEMAIQTDHVGGAGLPIFEAMPTEAPSLELMKRRLEARAETNTCTEWTILGDNGVPVCSNSQTCIFSTVGTLRYEGCGLPNRGYDWVTECWNYPQTQGGTAGPSQVFCDAASPTCGVFEFIFADGITFSNFGCAPTGYTYTATLTDKTRSLDIPLEPSTTSSPTAKPSTVYVLPTTTTGSSTGGGGGGGSKAPIGAIVGGVVGGIAVLALIGFIAWYCLRKRREDKEVEEKAQQQQANSATAAAYHSSQQTAQMNEMEGTPIKPGVGAFAPPLPGNHFAPTPEKNMVGGVGVERPGLHPNQHSSGYSASAGSPPPIYPQQGGQGLSPSSHFTELDSTSQSAVTPGTNMSELGVGDERHSYPGGHSPQPPPAALSEMSGSSATGGIDRPMVGRQRLSGVDMSGAPMSSDYRPQELP